MSNLSVFNFKSHEVRFIGTSDELRWVANDLCKALTITDTSQAVAKLDDDEKGTCIVRTPGGDQEMLYVNESGMYSLILTSRKPQAKDFKKWLTSEVIPSIRKTGSYSAIASKPQLLPTTSARINQLITKKASIQQQIKDMENALNRKKHELQEVSNDLVTEAKAFYDANPEGFELAIACKEIINQAKQENKYRSLPSI